MTWHYEITEQLMKVERAARIVANGDHSRIPDLKRALLALDRTRAEAEAQTHLERIAGVS